MVRSCIVMAVSVVCLSSTVFAGDDASRILAGRGAVKTFAGELKGKLVAALKGGGPVSAISVCRVEAPVIAARVSREKNLKIGRTSLRLRNPANAPDAWEQGVLETFEQRAAQGEEVADMEFSEVVGQGDGEVFRYMKAIPVGAPCLICHGEVEGELLDKIKSLYPDDQATGFSAGMVRGAFSVTIVE